MVSTSLAANIVLTRDKTNTVYHPIHVVWIPTITLSLAFTHWETCTFCTIPKDIVHKDGVGTIRVLVAVSNRCVIGGFFIEDFDIGLPFIKHGGRR